MRFGSIAAFVCFAVVAAGVAPAKAETKVELTNVHICCPACARAIREATKDTGAQANADLRRKRVIITAPDDKTAQKALDALAEAGFYGKSDNKDLVMKDTSGVKPGKVDSLSVTGVHNCCTQCCSGIKHALKSVPGVTDNTAKPKSQSFKVTGNFDAADVVKALNKAGFAVKVEK
jgi:copper chaperone CopZ